MSYFVAVLLIVFILSLMWQLLKPKKKWVKEDAMRKDTLVDLCFKMGKIPFIVFVGSILGTTLAMVIWLIWAGFHYGWYALTLLAISGQIAHWIIRNPWGVYVDIYRTYKRSS